jgi:hypothetical protein
VIGPLSAYLYSLFGQCTGVSFVVSPPLAVRHNKQNPFHCVFDGLVGRSMTSMGWFCGFKLHLVVNDRGELLARQLNRAMSMTASRYLRWPSDCMTNCLVIKATFLKS